jgi:SAM-dependent methyltransferase
MILSILFLFVQLGFVIYLLYYIITFISGAPFVPSTKRATEAMIAMANIKKGEKIYDLGSGDGRVLFLAVKKGAIGIGYELNPILVLYTKIRAFFSPDKKHITVRWKSLWKADIHNADVVFVYLLPLSLNLLQQKLLTELKPGTRIISNSFIFKNWPIEKQDKANHIFVFLIPKRVQ